MMRKTKIVLFAGIIIAFSLAAALTTLIFTQKTDTDGVTQTSSIDYSQNKNFNINIDDKIRVKERS